MGTYIVKVGTPEGRVFHREITADNTEQIAASLEKEGLYPISVRSRRSIFIRGFRGKGSDHGTFLAFNQGFVTLLKAGLPVIECLDTLSRTAGPFFSETIRDTIKRVRNGQMLSEAMAANPQIFSPLYTSIVSAGESTGDLIPSLKGYIEYQKRIEDIRKKVVSSVTYPAVLAAASLFVIAFLIMYVIPSFASIYIDSGADLPLPTELLIWLTRSVEKFLLLILLSIAGAGISIFYYFNGEKGRTRLDSLKLAFPGIGEIYRGYAVSKFSRTLGMLLRSGLPLITGMKMAKAVFNNHVLEERLDRVIRKTRDGGNVSTAMEQEDILPEITLRMFAVGERSASLPDILEEISAYHDQEVDYKVGILTDMIEPALMIMMGIIIGTIVILMYLPIFQLGARI